ncbi:polysaccharide biosynthesis C-terminal domain-containing protein [Algoriphagus sp. AGSA1]|uniref:oligosaccharide flippase family protein n=1 Tax=Algoriphagus sp. AGSA1 TaxID=2907213 RepID=UPI001F266888|nr:polysaccharide biosynthesis C-terminal domain-containing protein [Algoriphagus sp. AGSA1]MCE7053709.1 polysaccharide biosynthesis C-terminal domain-containing protein [Algoriphagus sp. AGSA1]
MSSFIKDLARVATSNVAIIFFGVATSIVTARFIGPEGNGIIAGLIVYPSLFMSFGSLGIRQSTAYFLGKKIYSEDRIKTAITQIWSLTTIVSLIVCFVLMTYFSKSGENFLWVILALLPIPFSLFITYNSGIFLGRNDLQSFNKVNWVPPFIVLVVSLILVGLFNQGVQGALIAAVGGQLFMAMFMLFKNEFLKAFSLQYDFKVIKSMLSLGIVYAIALLIINLNYKVDVILLDKLSTSYELGIYSKGAGIIQYLWQIPMVLSTIIFSRSASAKDDYVFSLKVAQLLRISLVIVGGASLVLFFLSNFVILTMYGEAFRDSISVLKILLPGVLLLTVFKVMNMDLAGKGKPWISMKAMVPALILNVVLNLLWIQDYGANGASFASSISYSVAAILFAYFYCKETKVPAKELFGIRKSDFNVIFSKLDKLIPKKK